MQVKKIENEDGDIILQATQDIWYQVIKNDNEQIIKTMTEYAKAHNVELRLLDEDKVKEIIKIGCKEYLENKNDFISKDKIYEIICDIEYDLENITIHDIYLKLLKLLEE